MKTHIAELFSADLKESQMTFDIQEPMIVKSGIYAIVPIEDYEKLVNGETKETEKALDINDVSSSNGFTRHSTCCNEEVTVIGEVTKYYQCNYCKQPCDTEMLEDEKS